jgi:hypothetical protein
MAKPPRVHELEFLKLTQNHAEFARKLGELQLASDGDLVLHAHHVALCWYQLSLEHLDEARLAAAGGAKRTVYSRAYYAAYNASKAVRYLFHGWVSLKGDDHQQASVLPPDFPDAPKWSLAVTRLYEDRLHADYDNWRSTATDFTSTTTDAVTIAETFIAAAKAYLLTKYQVKV